MNKAEECKKEFDELLKKYSCKVDVTLVISTKAQDPQFVFDFVEVADDVNNS